MKNLLALALACLSKLVFAQSDSLNVPLALVYAPSGYSIPIRNKPNRDSKELTHCNSVDSLLLLQYKGGMYYRVKTRLSQLSVEGYLYIDFLKYDEFAVSVVTEYNKKHGGTVRLKYVAPPKYYKSQGTKAYISSDYSPSPSSGSSPSNHTIHTGPRGGKYYINKNGNKTYVKKKK